MIKNFAKTIVRSLGYQISRIPPPTIPGEYGPITPRATYTPWHSDRAFLAVYDQIRAQTKVDIMRCYELWALTAEAAKVGGAFIEVGTWRGGTVALIAKRAQQCGLAGPVFACDTFAGVVKATNVDGGYRGGEYADASQEDVERLLGTVGASNGVVLKGIFPDETANAIPDGVTFALAHIDVDVYQSAKDSVEWIWPRLAAGGIVVYDDYGMQSECGITKYVNEQIPQCDRLVLYNLNGHGIVIKR